MDVQVADTQRKTPFLLCAEQGHAGLLRYMISQVHEDVEQECGAGRTAIHYAATARSTGDYGNDQGARTGKHVLAPCTVPTIGKKVRQSNRSNSHGWKAGTHEDCIRLLIEHGANINAVDKQRKTALHVATLEAHTNPAAVETVACLLRNKVSTSIKDSSGKEAQDYAKTDELIAAFKGAYCQSFSARSITHFLTPRCPVN
jgi:ankyrin repeat protein